MCQTVNSDYGILFSSLSFPYFSCFDKKHNSQGGKGVLLRKMGGLFIYLFICPFFGLLGLHAWHSEVPRPGVKLELYLPATATATWDLSLVCDLHHSSWQHPVLNSPTKARDQTQVLMYLVGFVNHWAAVGILGRGWGNVLKWGLSRDFCFP